MKAQDKRVAQQKASSSAAHNAGEKSLQRIAVGIVQKVEPEEELQQHKSDGTVQKMEAPELDEEYLAGVKQHKLNAYAYAQGTDIHLASGQEKHLPHEAWHVVQQKQGRVQPTMQMKDKVNVNDDMGLEKEADIMGGRATGFASNNGASKFSVSTKTPAGTVQRMVNLGLEEGTTVVIVRSTSEEFHGDMATIMGPGKESNEYMVRVNLTKETVFVRADQLSLPQRNIPKTIDVDTARLGNTDQTEIFKQLNEYIIKEFSLKAGTFHIGGSFAAFMHAKAAKKPARIPRDIDVIVSHKDFVAVNEKNHGMHSMHSKPFQPGQAFYGIPIEIHFIGNLIEPHDLKYNTERKGDASVLNKNLLLAKAFKKPSKSFQNNILYSRR